MINDFDRFFLNLPPFDREQDFGLFWEQAFAELKRIPIEPVIEKRESQTPEKFEIFDTVFTSNGRYKVKGELYIPASSPKKPKVIIYIHDYNNCLKPGEDILEPDVAFFFIQLRGHESLLKNIAFNNNKEEKKSPGFMIENITEKNNYFFKNIYLDVFRSVDFLRLNDKLECGSIGLIGKGLGAAAAVFTAAFSNRIKALVLDSPSFCYLELNQNISKSDATNEINSFLLNNKSKRKAIKKNLSYFDAINHSDKINIPVLVTVGLRDSFSPPECTFALFNHFLCEKTVEVYPEDDHTAGGDDQLKKSITWAKEIAFVE